MSKHRDAKKRPTRGTPPEREARQARPRASGGPEPQSPTAANRSVSRPEPAGATRPTHEQIAARAYEIWEAQGRPEGADRENWFEAERQLRATAR
jgi:hypothetical protein